MNLRSEILRRAEEMLSVHLAPEVPTAAGIIRDLHVYTANALVGPPEARLEAGFLFAQIESLRRDVFPPEPEAAPEPTPEPVPAPPEIATRRPARQKRTRK